jgi:hypothetical protein
VSRTSTSADPIADAHVLCQQHRLFIVAKRDWIFDKNEGRHRDVPVWIVYRKAAGEGCRPLRLGKRRDPDAVLRFVRKLTQGENHV